MFESIIKNPNSNQEKAKSYPAPFVVTEEYRSWDKTYFEYNPPYYIDPVVLTRGIENGWAESEDFSSVPKRAWSETYDIKTNEKGVPLNPFGRTGIEGRGLLGKWGANYAVDILIYRMTDTGREFLLIKRHDNHKYAFVGGMIDKGELASIAAQRELKEEADVDLSLEQAEILYKGYAGDFRSTDNAWIETTLFCIDVTKIKINPKAGDDAESIEWVDEENALRLNMHGSHGYLLRKFIETK